MLKGGVKPLTRSRFLVNDPDYAPFGVSWLRGITPARLGLVELVCLIFSIRQGTGNFLDDSLVEQISNWIRGAHIYVAASMPMLALVTVAERKAARRTNKRLIANLSMAVLVGAVVYASVINVAFGVEGWNLPNADLIWIVFPLLSYFLRALLTGGLLAGVLYFITREASVALSLQATRLNCIDLDRQMAEARLRVLQAQIEPHFLFNTLAHIKRLYLIDPTRGKAMLHDLADYLRAALPQMRETRSTVGRELAQARAYLNVLQGRMGDRLEVSIAVPDDLREAELPPMMLSTLVENAIKHGIAPLSQGGALKITAAREGARLRISVADNGLGFQGSSGSGVGLANTRARLAALYGPSGRLTFAANPVRGVTVSIDLPYEPLSARRAAA